MTDETALPSGAVNIKTVMPAAGFIGLDGSVTEFDQTTIEPVPKFTAKIDPEKMELVLQNRLMQIAKDLLIPSFGITVSIQIDFTAMKREHVEQFAKAVGELQE